MNIQLELSKQQRQLCRFIFILLMGTFFSVKPGKQIVIQFSKPVSIQFSKSSPARLALDAVNMSQTEIQRKPQGELVISTINLNEDIEQNKILIGEKSITAQKKQLAMDSFSSKEVLKIQDNDNFIQSLSSLEKQRIAESKYRLRADQGDILNQDWSIDSSQDLIKQKFAELKKSTPAHGAAAFNLANQSVDLNQTNTDGTASYTTEAQTYYNLEGNIQLSSGAGAFLPRDEMHIYWTQNAGSQASASEKTEQGRFDPSKNKNFSIKVPRLGGNVVAQLLDQNGQVKASGEFSLNPNLSSKDQSDIKIFIRPKNQIASNFKGLYDSDFQGLSENLNNQNYSTKSTSSQARYNFSEKKIEGKVLVGAFNEEVALTTAGELKVEGLRENSETLVRTQIKNFYPSISQLRSGDPQYLYGFPEKMVQAMLSLGRDIQKDQDLEENGSVIWGQVSSPFSAAGVEIEIEGHPELKPIYLNELMIPDSQLKGTVKSGYFVFIDLPPGFYSLRATRSHQIISFANIQVDNQSVSSCSLEESFESHPLTAIVFDAFTGGPQSALVSLQSLTEAVNVNGQQQFSNPATKSSQYVVVTPQNSMYATALYRVEKQQQEAHFPLISSQWILGLKSNAKISDVPGTATILGFSTQDNYQVELSHLPNFDRSFIVYFDSRGEPTQTPTQGGGFIIYNVPSGVQSVLYAQNNDNIATARLIPTDPGSLSVLKFDP